MLSVAILAKPGRIPPSLAWLPWKGAKAPREIVAETSNTKFAREDAGGGHLRRSV